MDDTPRADAAFIQPSIQLRLDFPVADTPLHLSLVLAGITVLVEERTGAYDEAYRELQRCSVSVVWHARGGLSFPVRDLQRLAQTRAEVTCDEDLSPLWEHVCTPSANDLPATLHSRSYGAQLQWEDAAGVRHAPPVPHTAIPALLSSGIPFVAENDAWRFIEQFSTVPVVAGRVRLNADGFLEIHTTTPQLVEASPLPALFRLDDTHYGMPASLAPALERASGFVWDSERPALARRVQIPSHIEMSDHVHRHAIALASQLDTYGAAAVVWSPGLGRRIAVLAALDALEAWPALVVCPPHAVWLWQRHVELVGREASLSSSDADVRIITYNDLRYVALEDPVAIVFDDPFSQEARANVTACHRLDALRDALRVSVSSEWSDVPEEVVRVLSLVRPAEFRTDTPVVWRYPARPEARLAQHAAAYVFELDSEDVPPGATSRFPRSSVAVCEPTTEQLAALAEYHEMLESGEDPRVLLSLAREAVTAGTGSAPSPKLAEAITRVRSALSKDRTVAVVLSSHRAANRLRMLLRPTETRVVDETEMVPPAPIRNGVVIVRASGSIPSLRAFDEVVVCEYPTSFLALDHALGITERDGGPVKVTLVHLARSLDDRIAISASLAREQGLVTAEEDPESLLPLRS